MLRKRQKSPVLDHTDCTVEHEEGQDWRQRNQSGSYGLNPGKRLVGVMLERSDGFKRHSEKTELD